MGCLASPDPQLAVAQGTNSRSSTHRSKSSPFGWLEQNSTPMNWVGASGCGLKTDGTVVCWGDNTYGQASPP